MKLIFMRHGEANDNVEQIFSSDNLSCSLLTKHGTKQARQTAKKLGKIDKVYYSPIFRAVQTANLIKEKIPNVEFVSEDRITEINYGIYNQQKNDPMLNEVRERQKDGDFFIRFGRYGENKFEIYNRLLSFIKDLEEKNFNNNSILIISHGSIIAFLMRILNIRSNHLRKGDFICINDVDFNEVNKTRLHFEEAVRDVIKQREKVVSIVNNDNLKSYLFSIAGNYYNDINFDESVLTELCQGFNDKLTLVSSNTNIDNSLNGNIICVCIFRNFIDFFQKWIFHYNELGVTKFALINCGSPKEINIIKKFANSFDVDIDFWLWSGMFSCNKECAIKQRIIDFYGKNNWYLLVDSDELFIFPNFKERKIYNYVSELESHQTYITKSLMIDVYPKGNILVKNNIDDWKYIDKDGYCRESKFDKIPRYYGGMRSRVFGIKSSIQKISLFKYTGKEFIANDHFLFPYILNNAPLRHILLHYKFQPGFLNFYKALVDEKIHWNDSSEYRKYLKLIEKSNKIDLFNDEISVEINYDKIFDILK